MNGSTNGNDAAVAIDCLDHPVSRTPATFGYLAALLKGVGAGLRSAPRMGRVRVLRVARRADADARTGRRRRRAAHPRGRHHG